MPWAFDTQLIALFARLGPRRAGGRLRGAVLRQRRRLLRASPSITETRKSRSPKVTPKANPSKTKTATSKNRNENDRRRRPLRGQGRAPQPAHRRPDRHRTGLLAGRADDRLRPRRRPLLGPRRRLRPAAADQRHRARLGAGRLARTAASSSSSGAERRGAGRPLHGQRPRRRRRRRADHQRRRRPRSRLLGRRAGGRLRPQRRRDRWRHGRRRLLDAPERRRPGAADQDRAARRVRARATSPAASSSAAARAARARRLRRRLHDAAQRHQGEAQVAGAGSAYVEDVTADGHTLLFRRDQGLWVKRIGAGKARKLSRAARPLGDQRRLLLRRQEGRRLRRGRGARQLVLDRRRQRPPARARRRASTSTKATAPTIGPVISWQPALGPVITWQPVPL